MTEVGTVRFTNPDEYSASIEAAKVSLVITSGGDFDARLTQLDVGGLTVLRAQENLPRIGCVTMPASRAAISFPASGGAGAAYCGVALRFGDIVFHGIGERAHLRTDGPSAWGLISVQADQLAAHSKALTGRSIRPSLEGVVMRPSREAGKHLVTLHSKLCRSTDFRGQFAVACREEMLHAVVDCLASARAREVPRSLRNHVEIMSRFEEALNAKETSRLNLPELCAAIGVPERTLRLCCAEFLG